jgi:hypothetical protein
MAKKPDASRSSYDPRSRDSDAPVTPEDARRAARRVARIARAAHPDDDQAARDDLTTVLGALGITRLAKKPKTRKARRR